VKEDTGFELWIGSLEETQKLSGIFSLSFNTVHGVQDFAQKNSTILQVVSLSKKLLKSNELL
jgi:hypothetical protein